MRILIVAVIVVCANWAECFSQQIIFRQPSEYVLSFIGSDSVSFSSINYDSYRIYFKDDSYTASHLSEIKKELDIAHSRILSILDVREYHKGIYLIAVDSQEEMEELMGYHIKGGAAKGHDLVFFVFSNTTRPQFKHEIFHLISYETWGLTEYRLLDEGAATYTDNFCFYDNPMYTINAYYRQQNELFSFESLVNDFDNQARENDVIAYIQSAGIFKYLYEKYGVEKIKQLWTEGFEEFSAIYGFSVAELEVEWKDFIGTIPIPDNFDIAKLNEGCG
ncbi:MAG: hypothetical protein MI700_01420 [Balneolales bacterium]|nr:hypothetical protein [Balneolales bacterium]